MMVYMCFYLVLCALYVLSFSKFVLFVFTDPFGPRGPRIQAHCRTDESDESDGRTDGGIGRTDGRMYRTEGSGYRDTLMRSYR
jgi:hypothetical protein